MLKFVDGTAVGQKADSGGEVCVAVFVGIGPEEVVHPGVGKEFHAHGVDFAGFVGGPVVFIDTDMAAAVDLEGVTDFVGEYIDITAGAIEVRKNEG